MAEKAMVQSGIYTITNTASSKVYVGSTVRLKKRWREHRSDLRHGVHDNQHLQRAWNKYSEDTFEFLVCEYVEDREQLYVREQYWLDWHRLQTEVYNCGLVARNAMLGRCHTEESLRKIGNAQKGRHPTGETRHRMSEAAKNKYKSPEARRKTGESLADSYPAFIHQCTGEVIPAGINFKALCRERGLSRRGMHAVKTGLWPSYKNWVLQSKHSQLWLL